MSCITKLSILNKIIKCPNFFSSQNIIMAIFNVSLFLTTIIELLYLNYPHLLPLSHILHGVISHIMVFCNRTARHKDVIIRWYVNQLCACSGGAMLRGAAGGDDGCAPPLGPPLLPGLRTTTTGAHAVAHHGCSGECSVSRL